MFEPLARYAAKQSTTALTSASLASDRLEEMERSIAAETEKERIRIRISTQYKHIIYLMYITNITN